MIINIFTSRPAVLIGKSGAGVEQMKKEIAKIARDKTSITIREVNPTPTRFWRSPSPPR